ncbi:MAG: acyl-CoA dehydrogenase family protein [Acidimicrobiia bacterium]
MDPRHTPAAEAFRAQVRAFLDAELPSGWQGIGAITDRHEADTFVERWRSTLADHGFIGVSWPTEYGGAGLGKLEQVVLVEELAKAGVPAMGYNDTFGVKMLGNTLLHWGTEAQKQQFLPRILSGDDRWCQGYSEPGAGSDLASLRCSAVRDGDRWVIDGQKVWTSRAREANWIFLLARTDPQAARPHQGITFLLVPLDQPGIDIRPIRALSGDSEFNEVFFDGAITGSEHVVGEVHGGWAVAMTLLGLERGEEAATNPILFRAELDRLLAMARERGASDDPRMRQRLADAHIRCEIMRMLGLRILTGVVTAGSLGPEASISKLYWSEYHRRVTDLALDVIGVEATTITGRLPLRAYRADDPGAPNTTGSWVGARYNAAAGTIYAGTSEIQRNILGESVLGLPR